MMARCLQVLKDVESGTYHRPLLVSCYDEDIYGTWLQPQARFTKHSVPDELIHNKRKRLFSFRFYGAI